MDVVTQYARSTGVRYDVTAEGGSDYIREKVLRAVLNAERDAIARGEMYRAALAPENDTFEPGAAAHARPASLRMTYRYSEIDGSPVDLQ